MWEDCGNNNGDSTRFSTPNITPIIEKPGGNYIRTSVFVYVIFDILFYKTLALTQIWGGRNQKLFLKIAENSLKTRLLLNVTAPSLSSFLLNDSLHWLFLFSCAAVCKTTSLYPTLQPGIVIDESLKYRSFHFYSSFDARVVVCVCVCVIGDKPSSNRSDRTKRFLCSKSTH